MEAAPVGAGLALGRLELGQDIHIVVAPAQPACIYGPNGAPGRQPQLSLNHGYLASFSARVISSDKPPAQGAINLKSAGRQRRM